MRDLYATLEVARTADAATIRKAYRKASKCAHPDGGGSPEKFREVSMALQVLTDPLRRKTYDETGKIEDKPADNEQSELMVIVSALLDQVLANLDQQSVPFEQADLIQRMRRAASERQTQINQQKNALAKGIAKQRKLLKRFKRKGDGENMMETLITGRLSFLEGQSAMGDRQLEQIRKAELFLADYRFESDSAPSYQSSQAQYAQRIFTSGTW